MPLCELNYADDSTNQIDFILTKQSDAWLPLNTKTHPSEERTPYHRLVISNFRLKEKQTYLEKEELEAYALFMWSEI